MLIQHEKRVLLSAFAGRFGLKQPAPPRHQDKVKKTEQILGYLEEIHVRINRYSRKRPLLLVEPAAGNCYLSFLAYHFYTEIDPRPVEVHCIDWNADLMDKNRHVAEELGFTRMHFHTGDITDAAIPGRPDIVYALHACDSASDGVLFQGVTAKARNILNVSCCQHGFAARLRPSADMRVLTGQHIHRDRFVHMAADAMRAKLMEMVGYRSEVVEFVSLKATGKNLLLRAERQPCSKGADLAADYLALRRMCGAAPDLEALLVSAGLIELPVLPRHGAARPTRSDLPIGTAANDFRHCHAGRAATG